MLSAVYKLLPETKGQSLENIEQYWIDKRIDTSEVLQNNQQ